MLLFCRFFSLVFSRDEPTLYEAVSAGLSVGWSVGNAFAFPPAMSDLCSVYGLLLEKDVTMVITLTLRINIQ